jgi:hypothetical protein
LIENSPDVVETALTLIGARARGAQVPDDLLTRLVIQSESDRVWTSYSYLGANECHWILENRPDKLHLVADAALNLVPQEAIPLLLDRAIGDNRQLHSSPDHPLRKIEDWVKSGEPGTNRSTSRRQTLLDSALQWYAKSVDADITLRALAMALSPKFADSESDPGSGRKFTLRRGLLTPNEMTVVRSFWPKARGFLLAASVKDWRPAFDLVHDWLYPSSEAENVSEGIENSMRQFAREMAVDITGMNASHPGVQSRILRMFDQFEVQLPISLDAEFDTLFPVKDWGQDRETTQASQSHAAQELAHDWSSQEASEVAVRMVRYESEARAADLTWPHWSPYVAERIASGVPDPLRWALAFIQAGADSELVVPFLSAVAAKNPLHYPQLLDSCLKDPRLQFAGVSVGLTATFLPASLLAMILAVLDERFGNWVELSCARRQIPEDRVAALLSHPNRTIAASAAVGVWLARPKGPVPDELKGLWRKAVVNCLETEYWGKDIFREDPSIACDWLESRITGKHTLSYLSDDLTETGLQVINLKQRKHLLALIGDGLWNDEVVRGIVDDELEVYRVLLQNPRLKRFHLAPLAGKPDGPWISKALLALEAGYSHSDVAGAVYGSVQSWNGDESAHWAQWVESFEPLLEHSDPAVREIGEHGRNRAVAKRDRALAEERLEDIRGFDH